MDINYFISAIGGCVSAIIFLVFWLKTSQEKNEKKTAALNETHEKATAILNDKHEEKIAELYKKHEERLTEMYRDGLKMTQETLNTINRNTDAIDRIPKNPVTINDLHQFLTAQNKK